jgi:hypothetical protein
VDPSRLVVAAVDWQTNRHRRPALSKPLGRTFFYQQVPNKSGFLILSHFNSNLKSTNCTVRYSAIFNFMARTGLARTFRLLVGQLIQHR